jgi:hypothetical protein
MDENPGVNPVEAVLLEHIDDPASLFVFPTDIAMQRWADRLLALRKGGTIAMEKFIAWDTFKQESIRAQKQDKKSVPAVLRKIFASRLVRENAELAKAGKPPLFASLLPPQYAYAGAAFVSWFAGILPQLGAWFEKTSGVPAALVNEKNGALAGEGMKGDDRDLFVLASRYQQFLDSHGLFEPAWERPPFDDTGKRCFIFFPESLMDYGEYAALLESSGHVTPVRLPAGAVKPGRAFFYTNARSEIAEAALYIRALHENRGIPFEAIAVSISDEPGYEPYVLREFANRNIPFARRAGKPLASYAAGRLFSAIADCVSRDFAFDALAGLLLNTHLPWKHKDDIDQLINFGIKNNCIVSWKETGEQGGADREIHVWEDAFKSPMGNREERARSYYENLKGAIEKLCKAPSFADLRDSYFAFRGKFFDMDSCLPETDLILSRCVSELLSLIEIEKSFPDIEVPDLYAFFSEYLQEKNYLPQQNSSGVAILPYRTAAPAPFECHIVVGATQNGLSTVFSRLGFLPRAKREALGLQDDDASEAFINLHRFNSRIPAAFFCARDTFSGYAMPHSFLNVVEKPRMRYALDDGASFAEDLFAGEQKFFGALQSAEAPADFPARLHQGQALGFAAWASRAGPLPGGDGGAWEAKTALLDLIEERFARNGEFPGKYSVSPSSLGPYYTCALQWLFQRVLNLENIRIETNVMAENVSGSLYHAILNWFFSALKKDSGTLSPLYKGALPQEYDKLLAESIDAVLKALPAIFPGTSPEVSALTVRLIRAGRKTIRENMETFLAAFLRYFAGYRVVESETSWKLEREDYYLNGTVDCILEDRRENSKTPGALTIVDFKLYTLPDREACDASGDGGLLNFQLPLYMTLAEEGGKKPIDAALFFSIIQAKPQALFGVIDNRETGKSEPREQDRILRTGDSGPDERFQLIMREFWEKTERYAAEIRGGSFSTISDSFKKCASCKNNTVCRTTYRVRGESGLLNRKDRNG